MTSWLDFGEVQAHRGFEIIPCAERWTDGDYHRWYVVSDAGGRLVHFERDEPTSLCHAQKLIDELLDSI